jgi:ferredoxin
MLKLVESLGAKAERAKRTTIEYLPLQDGTSHHCAWCGLCAKGRPKGWQRYKAF